MAPDLITGQKVKYSITDTQILHVSLFYKRTLCTGGELFIFQTPLNIKSFEWRKNFPSLISKKVMALDLKIG